MHLDPIKILGLITATATLLAVLIVFVRRYLRQDTSEEINAAQQSAAAWEKLATVRAQQMAECEQRATALKQENEQLRRERDSFERAIDRRLSEILELHGQIDELKRTRPTRRRGQNEHGD
jgi:septal ring factor EnvC (AmiA/AmiB activator)